MTKIERFINPPSFEEVDLSEDNCPLSMKDVSKSRKELWLIRAPLGFDCSAIEDVTLNLDGDPVEFSSEGDNKKYEAVSVRQNKENEGRSPYLLLPSQEGRNLEPGPAFKGQIVIMESPSLPPSNQSLPEIKQSEAPKMPEGLIQRFKPFGWEKLSSPMKKKTIKEEIASDDGSLGHIPRVSGLEISDGDEEQDTKSKKNKKKAKRKHEKKEVSEENSKLDQADDVLDESEGSPRKKKKKKKSKDK
ncbi:DNA-directed RNA polymerase I subunit RPA34-like isoform X2 [Lytechinus variegatus]|uniref:DNA-directed RNA polymerase I subunit RPA34-like isoform X2 n=1 Tax=Lytechinus variegatus TaxID=7654 RepID=UPI001BB18C02|nr:DNA-directed RNA polymerase I subunit RPA34-like isoform X2 [Lytechinus variegatus]